MSNQSGRMASSEFINFCRFSIKSIMNCAARKRRSSSSKDRIILADWGLRSESGRNLSHDSGRWNVENRKSHSLLSKQEGLWRDT